MINEDKLVRVLESFEKAERRRPRLEAWAATFGIFITVFAVLNTADFHNAGPIAAGDVRLFAVVIAFISGAATVALFGRWVWYALRHRHPETAEDKVAKIKKQAEAFTETLRAAEERLSAPQSGAVSPSSALMQRLKSLRLQAELLKQTVPAFQSQSVSAATEQSLDDWQRSVSEALAGKPNLKQQFDGASDENPILAAFKAHPLSIRLANRITVLDAIIKYLTESDDG
jgi:hypothetical protein